MLVKLTARQCADLREALQRAIRFEYNRADSFADRGRRKSARAADIRAVRYAALYDYLTEIQRKARKKP